MAYLEGICSHKFGPSRPMESKERGKLNGRGGRGDNSNEVKSKGKTQGSYPGSWKGNWVNGGGKRLTLQAPTDKKNNDDSWSRLRHLPVRVETGKTERNWGVQWAMALKRRLLKWLLKRGGAMGGREKWQWAFSQLAGKKAANHKPQVRDPPGGMQSGQLIKRKGGGG